MSTTTKKAQITFPSETQLQITRDFDAPRDLVWLVYTSPEHIRAWFGCGMMQMAEVTSDFRVGGSYRYVGVMEGEQHPFSGEFEEIAEPERLVFTETYEPIPGSTHTCAVTFEDLGGGRSRITEDLTYSCVEARDGHVASGMEYGLNQSYDAIEQIAQRLAA